MSLLPFRVGTFVSKMTLNSALHPFERLHSAFVCLWNFHVFDFVSLSALKSVFRVVSSFVLKKASVLLDDQVSAPHFGNGPCSRILNAFFNHNCIFCPIFRSCETAPTCELLAHAREPETVHMWPGDPEPRASHVANEACKQ